MENKQKKHFCYTILISLLLRNCFNDYIYSKKHLIFHETFYIYKKNWGNLFFILLKSAYWKNFKKKPYAIKKKLSLYILRYKSCLALEMSARNLLHFSKHLQIYHNDIVSTAQLNHVSIFQIFLTILCCIFCQCEEYCLRSWKFTSLFI